MLRERDQLSKGAWHCPERPASKEAPSPHSHGQLGVVGPPTEVPSTLQWTHAVACLHPSHLTSQQLWMWVLPCASRRLFTPLASLPPPSLIFTSSISPLISLLTLPF